MIEQHWAGLINSDGPCNCAVLWPTLQAFQVACASLPDRRSVLHV